MTVGGYVYRLGAGTQNRQPGAGQRLGEVYGGLPSELHHRRRRPVINSFVLNNIPDRLIIQWFKVEAVAGIKIGGNRFRVGVDHNAGYTGLGQGRSGMNAAIVKLNALADSNRAAADNHRLITRQGWSLVFFLVSAVIVGSDRLKLGSAGIHHLIDRPQIPTLPQVPHLLREHIGQGAYLLVGEAQPFGPAQQLRGQRFGQEATLHSYNPLQGANKPGVNKGLSH